MTNWFWSNWFETLVHKPDVEPASDVNDFLIFFTYQPNIGAGTNEPSVQEMIFKYYNTFFDTTKAEQLTNLYVKELTDAMAKKASTSTRTT